MGFLSSVLPTVVGAGVGVATGNPVLGAAAAGALGYAQSGSLTKGLMAGLAGYGGAGLGQALAQQGMQEAATSSLMEEATKNAAEEGLMLPPEYQSAALRTVAAPTAPTGMAGLEAAGRGLGSLADPGGLSQFTQNLGGTGKAIQTGLMASAPLIAGIGTQGLQPMGQSSGPNPYRYRFERGEATPFPQADRTGIEMSYFPNARYVPYAGGGPVEAMSDANAVGANTGFPMADIARGAYATPYQQPISQNVVTGTQDTQVDPYTGQERFARGGLSDLGDYSDGGRLLRGPGDGVSDSIPATIGNRRPARLADGEFVVPARIVSELGNGSTEAGARKLYAMMDRVQKARGKTVGKERVAKNTRADKYLPA